MEEELIGRYSKDVSAETIQTTMRSLMKSAKEFGAGHIEAKVWMHKKDDQIDDDEYVPYFQIGVKLRAEVD